MRTGFTRNYAPMSKKPDETKDERRERLAAQFTRIRDKTGLSMDEFARLLDYARASSIQRYGNPSEHTGEYLKGRIIERMLDKLPNRFGISEQEIRALGGPIMAPVTVEPGIAESSKSSRLAQGIRQARRQRGYTIRHVAEALGETIEVVGAWERSASTPSGDQLEELADLLAIDPEALRQGIVDPLDLEKLADAAFVSDRMPLPSGPRDVEKLGVVAAGTDGDFAFNGAVSEYITRPRGLYQRPGVFALEIISDSMYPAYRKGDIVFCDRTEPSIGDDVIIETFPEADGSAGKAFLKRLKRRSKSTLTVEQFNPPEDLTFDPYEIKHLWRVVPNRELHGY